jgi:hypothetical protein
MNGSGRTAGNDCDIAGKQNGAQDTTDDATAEGTMVTPMQTGMIDAEAPVVVMIGPLETAAVVVGDVVIATVTGPEVVTVTIGGAGGAPASPPATNPPEVVNSPSTFTLRGVTFA